MIPLVSAAKYLPCSVCGANDVELLTVYDKTCKPPKMMIIFLCENCRENWSRKYEEVKG